MPRLRIVVLGYVVRGPLGGLSWHYVQYLLGLERLGHEVFFIEDSGDFDSCYNPVQNTLSADPAFGAAFAARVFGAFGFGDRWAFHDGHTGRWLGPLSPRVGEICATADLCLNVSAVTPIRSWLERIPVRAFIDTDPAFTQIRHLTNADRWELARQHTVFFTFGENLPAGESSIPDDGLPWHPTRQPIVLDAWPVRPPPPDARFTSVLVWESYPAYEYDGRRYGLKADSLPEFISLPDRLGRDTFQLAFGSPSEPGRLLAAHGWNLVDPLRVAADPWRYQEYLQRSKAEFGVAKHGYVVSRSGWFSERSAAYLASGRPVLVQDTGVSSWLRCGEGVLPFTTVDDVAGAVDSVNTCYERHSRAAREIASECFDSDRVLTQLVETAMSAAPVSVPARPGR